jgi:hypothetical protein
MAGGNTSLWAAAGEGNLSVRAVGEDAAYPSCRSVRLLRSTSGSPSGLSSSRIRESCEHESTSRPCSHHGAGAFQIGHEGAAMTASTPPAFHLRFACLRESLIPAGCQLTCVEHSPLLVPVHCSHARRAVAAVRNRRTVLSFTMPGDPGRAPGCRICRVANQPALAPRPTHPWPAASPLLPARPNTDGKLAPQPRECPRRVKTDSASGGLGRLPTATCAYPPRPAWSLRPPTDIPATTRRSHLAGPRAAGHHLWPMPGARPRGSNNPHWVRKGLGHAHPRRIAGHLPKTTTITNQPS